MRSTHRRTRSPRRALAAANIASIRSTIVSSGRCGRATVELPEVALDHVDGRELAVAAPVPRLAGGRRTAADAPDRRAGCPRAARIRPPACRARPRADAPRAARQAPQLGASHRHHPTAKPPRVGSHDMADRVQSSTTNGAGADIDAVETREWIEAVDAVVAHDGPDRARELLTHAIEHAQHAGTGPIASLTTPYVNTIPVDREPPFPGDPEIERRLRSISRWNAMAIVIRANKVSSELGGHIAELRRSRSFTRSASTTSGTRPRIRTAAISCISRATPPGQLCAGLSGGPADRRAARRLPPGGLQATACRATRTHG